MSNINPYLSMNLQEAMMQLYWSEINCGVSSFWDGGWDVWIGDEMNGIKSKTGFDRSNLHLAAVWLINEAVRLYPKSLLAQMHARGLALQPGRKGSEYVPQEILDSLNYVGEK
jgi:hypothetical protein